MADLQSQSQATSKSRTGTSTVLWGHLLRKDTLSVPKPAVGPIAPVDKAGTSMRMLLHDTQAHLEKFASNVERLTNKVGEARNDTVEAKNLLQSGYDRLTGEMIELTDRTQTLIRKSISQQSDMLKDTIKGVQDADRRMESMDKTVNAVHMLLQTQMQAIQAMQDQQATLLTTLSPVLPLVQGLPLYFDRASRDLGDLLCSQFKESQQQYGKDTSGLLATVQHIETDLKSHFSTELERFRSFYLDTQQESIKAATSSSSPLSDLESNLKTYFSSETQCILRLITEMLGKGLRQVLATRLSSQSSRSYSSPAADSTPARKRRRLTSENEPLPPPTNVSSSSPHRLESSEFVPLSSAPSPLPPQIKSPALPQKALPSHPTTTPHQPNLATLKTAQDHRLSESRTRRSASVASNIHATPTKALGSTSDATTSSTFKVPTNTAATSHQTSPDLLRFATPGGRAQSRGHDRVATPLSSSVTTRAQYAALSSSAASLPPPLPPIPAPMPTLPKLTPSRPQAPKPKKKKKGMTKTAQPAESASSTSSSLLVPSKRGREEHVVSPSLRGSGSGGGAKGEASALGTARTLAPAWAAPPPLPLSRTTSTTSAPLQPAQAQARSLGLEFRPPLTPAFSSGLDARPLAPLPQTATLGTMMSLKERRATQAPGLGKRFLPIDDEEDDEDIPFDSP